MSRRRAKKVVTAPVWRVYFIAGLLALMPLALVVRLVSLQVLGQEVGPEFLQREGAKRSVRVAEIPAYRGMITDRRGAPLAVSTPVITLVGNPRFLRDSSQLDALAEALGVSESELRRRIELYAGKQFMYLARHKTPVEARRVLELDIQGVTGQREYRRFYPAGEVTAHVVGLTNIDGQGSAGLEQSFDDWLRGVPGKKRYLKDLNGEAIRDIGVVESAEPGRKLPLSIDLRLQFMQHRELKRTIAETGAAAASAVTVDAWTGEVLAMTNYPVFNPNNRADIDWAASRNRALTDEFEPGSTMKPLTLVAALESGQYGIDSIIDTSPGRIRVGSKVQHDPLNYGPISLSRVIEKSSQVGVTKVAQAIGHEAILDVFARFGLGAPTSIGFPGERTGSLPEHDYWSEIDKVTVAFGYSLTATPLQLAQAYAVFANRGERVPLTFLRRESESRVPGERVVTPEVAEQVVEVLHGVTADDATGHKARVDGYEVGGKTGTVHKVGNGQYLDNEYVALFVGVAPVEQPRYVTAVVIDRPKGDAYGGGAVAAPLYSRITEGVLRLRNIVPMLPEPLSAEAAVAALGGDQ